jgi:tetratricopeptide (TPR) repeat protein
LLIIVACFFITSAICLAEETEYWDWKGLKNHASKNYTEALGFFDKAIRQDPNYVDAWVHKGDTLRAMKDYNASLQNYSVALTIDKMRLPPGWV